MGVGMDGEVEWMGGCDGGGLGWMGGRDGGDGGGCGMVGRWGLMVVGDEWGWGWMVVAMGGGAAEEGAWTSSTNVQFSGLFTSHFLSQILNLFYNYF